MYILSDHLDCGVDIKLQLLDKILVSWYMWTTWLPVLKETEKKNPNL
jgi:hypothetical protein